MRLRCRIGLHKWRYSNHRIKHYEDWFGDKRSYGEHDAKCQYCNAKKLRFTRSRAAYQNILLGELLNEFSRVTKGIEKTYAELINQGKTKS